MSDTTRAALFVDTTGQGFSRNLASLRDELLGARPTQPVRYFFADLESEDATTEADRRDMRTLLDRASADASHLITASDSKYIRGCRGEQGQRRVLLVSPRLNLVDGSALSGKPTDGYTDVVVPGGAFIPSARNSFPDARVHAKGLPVFAELVSAESRDRARRELATLCPGSVGKRVVVVTTQRSVQKTFGIQSVVELAASLPDDVFLVLDVPGALATLESAPASLADRVFVNDGALGLFKLLALGDCLLTSKFRDAVYFSVTGRSLLTLGSKRSIGVRRDLLPADYRALGIADVSDLPAALTGSYDESARVRFQATYAVTAPENSASQLVDILF